MLQRLVALRGKQLANRVELVGLLALGLFISSGAYGIDADRSKPLNFIADKLTWDQRSERMKYSGNVEIHQGEMLLNADTVMIKKKKGKSAKISTFIARGKEGKQADFRDLPRAGEAEVKAWADTMMYDVTKHKLKLSGAAKILRGGDEIKAETLYYYVDTSNIEARTGEDKASGSKRINITISPETLSYSTNKKAKSEGASAGREESAEARGSEERGKNTEDRESKGEEVEGERGKEQIKEQIS